MTTFHRKTKELFPVVAICYDFDKTLSPDDMQAQGFLQAVGYEDVKQFWDKSNNLAKDLGMDQNLAYMHLMIEEAAGKAVFTAQTLRDYGAKVSLFEGVDTWFDRIRDYGREKGVIVEHYIISSGLKEMIEGTAVAQNGAFEAIYASSFYYNEKGVAVWPSQVINYTNKTQFLFRIEKGILDINDPAVNDAFKAEDIRVPFRNMIYIGDSDTDIPCMKLVNSYGGYSIGVYNEATKDKSKVYKMIRDNRIKHFAPANYAAGHELENLVKAIIDRTALNEKLESSYYACKREVEDYDKMQDEQTKKRTEYILLLENSNSFATTHEVIAKLSEIKTWPQHDAEKLINIALKNTQIRYILKDQDVKEFYKGIIDGMSVVTEAFKEVKGLIGEFN